MRLRNWIYIGFMIVLLGYWALQGSPVWGGSETEAPASIENMAYPLPNKPSIAVLPFDDTSDDSKPKFISDGFTATLIDALSENPSVFTISAMSTFKYKGKPFTIKQVAEELGVHYVVKGNFQKSGDQLQIAVQMIDALKGYPVWSERYDLNIRDTFKIQNDITLNMIKSAGAKYDKLKGESHPVEGTNNIVEAICSAARATLVAETADSDMYAAIDLVVDKLEKQIIKQKEKLKQPRRSNKGERSNAEGLKEISGRV